jgi:hypothetical protein
MGDLPSSPEEDFLAQLKDMGVTQEEIDAEIKRRKDDDAWYAMELRPTQRAAEIANKRYTLITGKNRGGKTAYGAYVLAGASRMIHPFRTTSVAGTYLLMAPNRKQLSGVWAKKLLSSSELGDESPDFHGKPLLPSWEIKHIAWAVAGVPEVITLRNNKRIMFAVSSDKSIYKRLKGLQLLGVVVDEDAGNEQLFNELYSRILDTNSNETIRKECGGGWILWGCTDTDGNPQYTKFKEMAARPDEYPDHAVFTTTEADDPPRVREERNKLKGMVSDWDVRHGDSEGAGAKLAVYGNQWDDAKHVLPADVQPSPQDTIWLAYDDGFSHPWMGCLFFCTKADPFGLTLYQCLTGRGQSYQVIATTIANALRGRFVEGIVYDIAMHKRSPGEGRRACDLFYEALVGKGIQSKRGMIPCKNPHKPGIMNVRRYLRPNGWGGRTEPMLRFNPSCRLAISQMKAYRTHMPDEFTGEKGVIKNNDEAPDCIRYMCEKRPNWTQREPNPAKWAEGYELKPAPEVPAILTPEQANIQEQLRRSREMYQKTYGRAKRIVF